MTESDGDYSDDLSGRPAAAVLGEIAALLRGARRVLLTTHVRPDGDAIGSVFALALTLRDLGVESVAAFSEVLPERYRRFVPERVPLRIGSSASEYAPYDWCGVLDTSEPDRVGDLETLVFASGQRRFAIDHHIHRDRKLFDRHLVVSGAASTASLVLEFVGVLGVPLSSEIAALLWLGLSTDTGWFRFSNTSARVLSDAARLLEAGSFDPEPYFESVYGEHRLARMRLVGHVLEGLRSTEDGSFVWGVVTREVLARYGVEHAELEGLIDQIRSTAGAHAVALITENAGGGFKVSLRAVGDVDVEALARSFGGGGHKRAAGCSFTGSLAELESSLVERLREGA